MIKIYSTHCPQCKVLEQKLNEKNLTYEICDDIKTMVNLGIENVPVLEISDKRLNFSEAIKWVNAQ